MSDAEKCKTYKETQTSINKLLEKNVIIDKNVYVNQLLLIKNDLAAKNENVKKASLEMLDFLLSLNVRDIQTEVIKILLDSTVNKLVQNNVLKSIKKKIKDTILEDNFDLTEILLPWKNQNVNKLTNIIEELCLNDLSRNKCKTFFIYKVIPTMLELSTDNDIRDILTDMAFILSTIVPISDLTESELQEFLRDVNTRYVKNIGDLRDQNYGNWHNLWIFLVRFSDKNIHNSMELTNRLLRVVEYAFRNSSIQQRLKGYDCWKELIDNASLDMRHMCSPKQIKLLVTPLKAKFSKQEVVICKRFDVFAYLLEKLQNKAVLCLTEFLEFCFGPIGDNKDVTKVGQGKTVPQIWTKSTKVLVDIIGHSHTKSVPCLITEDVIKLERPVINHINISVYYKVIINSVGECGSLLKEVDIESKRETVIKCMWKSIFNLVIPTPENVRGKYFQVISDVLENYIKQSRENPYFEDLLILIVTVLLSYDKEFVYEIIQYILKQLLTILFTTDNFPFDVADNFKEVLSHTFSKMLMVENKLRVMKDIMYVFMKTPPSEENICQINKIWLCLANELISDFTAHKIEDFIEFNSFFMWPTFHLHHLDESAKKQTVLHWMKLYRKVSLDNEERKQSVMRELEKIFKNNPLLSSNVVSLLNVMSQFETKFTKEFVIKLMGVSSLILLLPNLKTEDEQKITALVMQYFEPSLECYKCDQNEDVIKNICICIEHILCFHKGYKLLDTLSSFIRNSPEDLKAKFSQNLSKLVADLYNKESDVNSYTAKELYKVIQVFNKPYDDKAGDASFTAPIGRSARIANLVKNSPKSPNARIKKIDPSPTALRLFGKDLDTSSPLRVKGSQLNNVTPVRARKSVNVKSKPKNSPSINEEKSQDFVPIDSEVRFQPEKLSRHQREVLQRRREDIPALYQDLSQSTSQDMFNSSSSSRSINKHDKENTSDSKKVIVEVIGHHFQKEDALKLEQPLDIPPQHIEEVTVSNMEVRTDVELSASSNVHPEETTYQPPEKSNQCSMETNVSPQNLDKHETSATKESQEPEKKESKFEDVDEKERKRRAKIEAELMKLKMDIVGADEFFAASRRTRTREKPKRLDDIAKPVKDEQHSRLSLAEPKSETKTDKGRRKTIGTVKDVKDPKIDIIEAPKQREKPQLATPKTFKRKSMKTKEDNKTELKEESRDKLSSSGSENAEIGDNKNIVIEEKKGEKRKRSSSYEEESEDIIESSQESRVDVTPLFNSSRRRSFRSSIDEKQDKSEEKTLVQQKTVTMSDFVSEVEEEKWEENVVRKGGEVENEIKVNEMVVNTEVQEEVPPHFEEVGQEVEISDMIEEVVDMNMGQEKLEEVTEFAVNTTQDTTITQESTQEISNAEDLSQNDTQDTASVCMTQDTQTQDVETQSSEDTRPPVLYFDLPKKPELTDSERIICRMDTMSICSDPNNLEFNNQIGDHQSAEELEIKVGQGGTGNKEDVMQMEDVLGSCTVQDMPNLPSSPITVETPNRTTELLNNTLDISPISSKGSSDSDTSSISVSRNFKTEMEELERIDKEGKTESTSDTSTEKPCKEEVDKQQKIMDQSKNEDLPSSIEDIINILEGNPMKKTEDTSSENDIWKHSEDAQQFEAAQEVTAVSDEIGNNENRIEYVCSEIAASEDVPRQLEDTNSYDGSHDTVYREVENLNKESENISNQVEVIKPLKENNGVQERASKLLNMVVGTPSPHKIFIKKRVGGMSMSPSSGRIKRLMSGINQKHTVEDMVGDVRAEDILTFSREVPSPLAVPRGSILKRKLSDTSDEGISPCAKRKRVNFSDPCLTSKKVFIKDDYRDNVPLEAKCLFPSTPETKPEHSRHTLDFSCSERMTESENIETEPSLEVINPLILRRDRPIYPKLVECEDDVIVILKKVTSPIFMTTLTNKMWSKGIRTIGDLAKQSESEINRFPFKVPVVANVYRALDNYYKKNIEKFDKNSTGHVEAGLNGVGGENGEVCRVDKKTSPIKVDFRTQFMEFIERSKAEGTIEDLTKILLSSQEKQPILTLVKSSYKLEPTDFLGRNDFKSIIKHITDTVGLPGIFEILTESMDSSENESVYFDCMIKHSIDKRPLIDLLESRSLSDIKTGLQETICKNIFSRSEVLDVCFLPLIESPSDISNYLNRISIVQLGEIVIERLQFSDLRQFFDKIIEVHGGKSVVRSLNEDLFKHFDSASDVVDLFKNCIGVQNEERQKEVLVEMFKFIGGRLDLNTLLELHIGFLRKIPNFVSTNEK